MKMMDKSTISVVIVLTLAALISFIGEPQGFADSSQAVWPLIIGGLVSLGSSIAGAAMGNKAAKEQSQAYDDAWANYEGWYDGQGKLKKNISWSISSYRTSRAFRNIRESRITRVRNLWDWTITTRYSRTA